MDPIEIWTAALSAALALAVLCGLMRAASALDRWAASPSGRCGPAYGTGLVRAAALALSLVSRGPKRKPGVAAAFAFAPVAALVAALAAAAPVQLAPAISAGAWRFSFTVWEPGAGLLFSLAMVSLWACASFLSMAGEGDRASRAVAVGSAAAYFSFFPAMMLALASVVLLSGKIDPAGLVADQGDAIWRWNWARQPVAFAIFAASSCMALRRVESGRFAGQDVARIHPQTAAAAGFVRRLSFSALAAALAAVGCSAFLGGWQLPFLPVSSLAESLRVIVPAWAVEPSVAVAGLAAMAAKSALLLVLFAFARASIASLRGDRLVRFAWRALMPLAMANLAATAYIVTVLSKGD
ncbi:MAG: NADH-quinone oxidoreductase subunit H [Proteobacteria bacterium]|nr:NADH-quinone oxidoreductase subunit H [Pseudomonadota bacterium]